MKFKTTTATLIVALSAILIPQNTTTAAEKDVVDTAVASGSFKTLVAALTAADLVDALKSDGPFTIFAPTDDAFAKLPKGTVDSLLKPENKSQLVAILTYHAVAGKIPASKVVSLKSAETLNGQRVDIKVAAGKVLVDDANVTSTDIQCSNGIIHVVDRVMLPSSNDIPTTAVEAGSFQTLVAAVKAAGLLETLAGDGPFTVFAPTDDAFAKLPAGTVETLVKPENLAKLTAILKYHVVAGRVFSDQALAVGRATTLNGGDVTITIRDGSARVNGANLVATDIDASNGVIHVIDAVLLPPDKEATTADAQRMMESVVARGAKLYNAGHADRCAHLYRTAMSTLLETENHGMSAHSVGAMRTALHWAGRTHNADRQAWILRHGIDRAYRAMSPTPAGTVSAQ